jgi:hypothetical protein
MAFVNEWSVKQAQRDNKCVCGTVIHAHEVYAQHAYTSGAYLQTDKFAVDCLNKVPAEVKRELVKSLKTIHDKTVADMKAFEKQLV